MSYHCHVRATNAAGSGPYSVYGATVTLPAAAVPGAPAVTGSTPAAGRVTVAFSAPANNGGSPITSYTAQCVSTDGGVAGLQTGSASPLQVTNLTATKSYNCHVRATNAAGTGSFGAYGATVLVTTTAPGEQRVPIEQITDPDHLTHHHSVPLNNPPSQPQTRRSDAEPHWAIRAILNDGQ